MDACAGSKAGESPYRQVVRYLIRSALNLDGDANLPREPETVGYWTLQLECGRIDEQITPPNWKIEDGHRQTAPNDPDEVARRKARMEHVKDCHNPEEYARALRQIKQGQLEPDPMTACWLCGSIDDRPVHGVGRPPHPRPPAWMSACIADVTAC